MYVVAGELREDVQIGGGGEMEDVPRTSSWLMLGEESKVTGIRVLVSETEAENE